MSKPAYDVRLDEEERYGDPFTVLRITRNGEVIEEHSDRGEPEDNSFGRDWSWVPDALRKAYALGVEDAQRASAAAAEGSCARPLAGGGGT